MGQESNVNFINENPPPYYPPQQLGPAPATVVYQPRAPVVVAIAPLMGTNPARVTCRSCQADIVTRTESRIGTRSHIFAVILCVVGLWPCVILPYCMDSCLNVDHFCPNCNAFVGTSRS